MSELSRIKRVDWQDKPEATICSQLIMPVLLELGYGEGTAHRVLEQHSYTLSDPSYNKGSRRIRLDYEPRVYEQGLWVMEAKGSDAAVDPSTLGQARDYAIHPEVRAGLLVTVDRGGFRVFDPWDLHWDEPILVVGLNEVADRIEELRQLLAPEHVAGIVRNRYIDHLKSSLKTTLEHEVVAETQVRLNAMIDEVTQGVEARRQAIRDEAFREADEIRERILRNSGVWGVVQAQNDPWIGTVRAAKDFEDAVMAQEPGRRASQLRDVRPAVEAQNRNISSEGSDAYRPLWWLSVVELGGLLALRDCEGCEPLASEGAAQKVRDCLLGFPDDPVQSASWRLQRTMIPLSTKIVSAAPLEPLSGVLGSMLSPEDKIRFPIDESRVFVLGVRLSVMDFLAKIEPWTAENLNALAEGLEGSYLLGRDPEGVEWIGPFGDPWLNSWSQVDPLLMCGIATLNSNPAGDDLLEDPEICQVISDAARSPEQLLSRVAAPLAARISIEA